MTPQCSCTVPPSRAASPHECYRRGNRLVNRKLRHHFVRGAVRQHTEDMAGNWPNNHESEIVSSSRLLRLGHICFSSGIHSSRSKHHQLHWSLHPWASLPSQRTQFCRCQSERGFCGNFTPWKLESHQTPTNRRGLPWSIPQARDLGSGSVGD